MHSKLEPHFSLLIPFFHRCSGSFRASDCSPLEQQFECFPWIKFDSLSSEHSLLQFFEKFWSLISKALGEFEKTEDENHSEKQDQLSR